VIDGETLLELLPDLYRLRDADQGGPLQALVSVLAEQADVVDLDVELLYDNWFVETCDPWLLPYIGELLAVRPIYEIPGAVSRRSYVANTIRYRRRKGTVSLLEQLAADVTGWPARASEFFRLLETTQYVNHLRPGNLRTPDLRDADGLELLGGPFERAAHTAEVRRIATRHGRYDIPNVGIFLWRLGSYPLALDDAGAEAPTTRGTACKNGTWFTFNPVGLDAPLFNDPSRVRAVTDRVEEEDVPASVRRRALYDELEALRRAAAGWPAATPRFFTDRRHVLRVWTQAADGDPFVEVDPVRILVADLSLGQPAPSSKSYPPPGGGAPVVLPVDVAVDPKLGRLTFPSGAGPNAVEVAYAYGFPADAGSGPYDRRDSIDDRFLEPGAVWGVGHDVSLAPGTNFASLGEAVQAWNAEPQGTTGVIVVFDSRTYAEDLTGALAVKIPEGSSLLIVGGERPTDNAAAFAPSGVQPHLRGALDVLGTAADGQPPGLLQVDGLLVEGTVTVKSGNLGTLRLSNCTVVPSKGTLVAETSPPIADLVAAREIDLVRAVAGAVSLADDRYALNVTDSAVDGGIDATAADVSLSGVTVRGPLTARTLHASNSILDGTVTVARTQDGCVRFSYVPAVPACRTPRRYRCQPDLALAGLTDPAARAAVVARVKPAYTSVDYGNPAYAQLDARCAVEIRTGAATGSEMGAYTAVQQPAREANLGVALDEYLPFGLEAGWFYVT
jgi:hypothetical protein